ncbi:MAG: hypothetical protein JKY61_06285 [Planctomycetes bacterium]|nr:hypothetical protein [Planctomycetota bacterium]
MSTDHPTPNKTFDSVVADLAAQLAILEQEESEAAAAVASTRARRKQVAAALRALSAPSGKAKRNGVSKQDAVDAIAETLADHPGFEGDELKDAVKARLKARGKPLTGLHLVLGAALREAQQAQPRITVDVEGPQISQQGASHDSRD